MIDQRKMVDVVNENFERYAGNVILDRAICDVRDMLKPSARMLIYSQMAITKNTHKKPFIKSARVVGDCLGHLYEHGESSCYGSYMRMSKDFTMRVPLEECQGNNGTMTKNSDEAAMRYTELRLSEIASYLYSGLDKNAIGDNWRNNFDETEQYPGVMPSIGYFNLCNGTQGLGIAISSSIPQFSLKEVNNAIIKLIQNSNIVDEDLIIMPDFATGGILTNAQEVYQALRVGQGAACKLRAVMNYNPDNNTIIITELPYIIGMSKEFNEMEINYDESEIKKLFEVFIPYFPKEYKYENISFKNSLAITILYIHFSGSRVVIEDNQFREIFIINEEIIIEKSLFLIDQLIKMILEINKIYEYNKGLEEFQKEKKIDKTNDTKKEAMFIKRKANFKIKEYDFNFIKIILSFRARLFHEANIKLKKAS